MHIFCIQRLYKSKFCMIMNVQEIHQIATYIQKNVQTVQNLYNIQTKNSLKLEICVFCTYKQCTNYIKPIQPANWNRFCMIFAHTHNVQTIQNVYKCQSNHIYMQPLMFVFLYIQKPYILYFWIFASTTIPSSVLLCNFVKFQDQSSHIQKGSQMNLYNRFI